MRLLGSFGIDLVGSHSEIHFPHVFQVAGALQSLPLAQRAGSADALVLAPTGDAMLSKIQILGLTMAFSTLTLQALAQPSPERESGASRAQAPDSLLSSLSLRERQQLQALKAQSFLDPEIVQHMDSRKLGEMMIARLHLLGDRGRDVGTQHLVENSADLIMMTTLNSLELSAKFGFKNQHQTGTTGGSIDFRKRLRVESWITALGLPYTSKTRELMPKYALQVFHTESMGNADLPDIYGDILIKFKPAVKKRATWSYEDSLVAEKYDVASSIFPLYTNWLPAEPGKKCGRYCEAQVWGALDLTDVESIAIPQGMPVSDRLKSFHLPIQTYTKPPPILTIIDAGSGDKWLQSDDANGGSSLYSLTGKSLQAGKPDLTSQQITDLMRPTDTTERLVLGQGYVFIPPSNVHAQKARAVLDADLQGLPPGAIGALKQMQFDTYLAQASSKDLLALYPTIQWLEFTHVPYESDDHALAQPKLRVLAELTARKSSPELIEFFKKELSANQSDAMKGMALMGLIHLPFAELKPILIPALADRGGILQETAGFIALKFKDDPDVRKALSVVGDNGDLLKKWDQPYLSSAAKE